MYQAFYNAPSSSEQDISGLLQNYSSASECKSTFAVDVVLALWRGRQIVLLGCFGLQLLQQIGMMGSLPPAPSALANYLFETSLSTLNFFGNHLLSDLRLKVKVNLSGWRLFGHKLNLS